ncbi:hypothetical protein VNI00_016138 [Paramarasmius palmivorus]|uniref:Uncharacterized protein n=1 Tax=Paramarasmius palmivorus TaxID=297713 RepID=A0AAW0BDU5_9AGAR
MNHIPTLILLASLDISAAITVEFPQNMIAGENTLFTWTRRQRDPQSFYITYENQNRDGSKTEQTNIDSNSALKGTGSVIFTNVGNFQIDVFDEQDVTASDILYSLTLPVFSNSASSAESPTLSNPPTDPATPSQLEAESTEM